MVRVKITDPICYVYAWFDEYGVPLYIGKGTYNNKLRRQRWEEHGIGGESHLDRKIRKANGKLPVVILHENITESEAIASEIALIRAIGRRNNGTGCLLNLTNGGDGLLGFRHSKETKEKVSKAKKGKPSKLRGRSRSKETLAKIAETKRNNPKPYNPTIVNNFRLDDPLVIERQRINRSAFFNSKEGKEHLEKMRANIDFDKLRETMKTDKYRNGQSVDALEGWQDPTIRENHCIGMKNAWKEHPKIWITNGIVDTWHAIDQGEIPIGWRRGRTNGSSSKTL
jgi:hypothetical protein